MDVNQRLEFILGESGAIGIRVRKVIGLFLKWLISHSLLILFAFFFGIGCFVTGLITGKRKY
jgi:hypothetical protein